MTTDTHIDLELDPGTECKVDNLLPIKVDKKVYVTTLTVSLAMFPFAPSEEGKEMFPVECLGRDTSRTADLPDGMKEPTKKNGEPMANTVSAKEGALAPGATHAFAWKESHPVVDLPGVPKSVETDHGH